MIVMTTSERIAIAKARNLLCGGIRNFFDAKGYLEVDTPTLSCDLIPEPTIENFSTMFMNEFLSNRELYMIPSPEVYMKKLMAEGFGSIYQISHCFRNCEQIGSHHNVEFSMLEYYSVGMNEQDSIALTEEMMNRCSLKDAPDWALPPFRKMSVNEAMMKYAGVDLDRCQSRSLIQEAAGKCGLSMVDEKESWEDTFNRIFLTFVEPNLPKDRPFILDEYPKQIDCLAKNHKDRPYKRRWEMYIGGVEVANCYDEETDPDRVQAYYQKEYQKLIAERTQKGTVIPDVDENYWKYFENFPQSSGVAIGMDRFLMVQLGKTDLKGVILFPISDILAHVN